MSITVMKQALEALEMAVSETLDYIQRNHLSGAENNHWIVCSQKAITSLRQAIAEAEKNHIEDNLTMVHEPLAYIRVSNTGHVMACAKTGDFYSLPDGTLLYTSPPTQSKARGLSQRQPQIWEHEGYEALCQELELWKAQAQRQPLDMKTIKRIATYCDEHITDEDVVEITRRVESEHGINGEA